MYKLIDAHYRAIVLLTPKDAAALCGTNERNLVSIIMNGYGYKPIGNLFLVHA